MPSHAASKGVWPSIETHTGKNSSKLLQTEGEWSENPRRQTFVLQQEQAIVKISNIITRAGLKSWVPKDH